MDKRIHYPGRRRFIGTAVAGLAAGSMPADGSLLRKKKRAGEKPGDGVKIVISHVTYPNVTPEMLNFMNQLGVDGIEGIAARKYDTLEHILRFKSIVEEAGLELYHVEHSDYNSMACQLGLPGRDEIIKGYCEFISNLGKAKIPYTTYAWTPEGAYRTSRREFTRSSRTDGFDEDVHRTRLSKVREYTDEELWDNFKYWADRVMPVAEEANVKLQLHPGDPPIDFHLPRIFRSNESYKRMLKICNNSPSAHIKVCVGTWGCMKGPDGKGEDVVGAIKYFGSQRRITGIHFRNVSGPLPQFTETFMDNGYLDMYAIIKALVEVDFQGTLSPDHVPGFTDEKRYGPMGVSGTPLCVGFIRGLLKGIQAELA